MDSEVSGQASLVERRDLPNLPRGTFDVDLPPQCCDYDTIADNLAAFVAVQQARADDLYFPYSSNENKLFCDWTYRNPTITKMATDEILRLIHDESFDRNKLAVNSTQLHYEEQRNIPNKVRVQSNGLRCCRYMLACLLFSNMAIRSSWYTIHLVIFPSLPACRSILHHC